MKYLTLFPLLLVLGCSTNLYPEFKVVDSIKILSDGAPNNHALGGDFLPYLHPVVQLPKGFATVLVGYIKYAEEYQKGVAYLVQGNQVLDSLVLAILDPPGDQWAEIGGAIIVHKENNMIEVGPEHEESEAMIFRYEITKKGFDLVED